MKTKKGLATHMLSASSLYSGIRNNPVAIATGVALATAFVLGGASRQHELRLAIVELVAIPALVIAVVSLLATPDRRPSRTATILLAALCILPLVQLLPLPPGIWTSLPGREELSLALELTGITPGWTTISLTPDKTWQAFLALIPPTAVFLGVLAVRSDGKLRLVQLLLAGIITAVLLGSAQLVSGGEQLYPWQTTDAGSVVGFFANRNHFATLCLISLPFAAALGAYDLRRNGGKNLWLSILFVGFIIVTLGVVRSRTGILLLGPTLAASLAVAWVASRGRPKPLMWGILASAALTSAVVSFFAMGPILARFDAGGPRESRFENWPTVVQAADAYLPVGSGIGSFDAVFRSVEPLERLDATFFNQAHNEYLEILLETGWLGVGLLVLFGVWFARRAWSAWTGGPGTQRDLQRASSIAIAVVLLHSVVDYPLRTETLATIFAMCCAMLEFARHADTGRLIVRQRVQR